MKRLSSQSGVRASSALRAAMRLMSTVDSNALPSAEATTDAFEGVRFEGGSDKLPRNVVQRIKTAYFRSGVVNCELCRTSQANVSAHQHSHGHVSRVAVVERALSCMAGVLPEELVHVIKSNLDDRLSFGRLPHLSDDDMFRRNRKLRYLLRFLVDHGFLAFTATTSTGRGRSFETCEMFGDNVVKWMLVDRLTAAFPPEQGGLSGGLFVLQSALDSNEGLRAFFDTLGLDSLFGVHSANSKSKSDVVEALFGEIQALIWSCECRWESRSDSLPATFAPSVLLTVLRHTLNEMAHLMILHVLDETLRNAKPVMIDLYDSLSEVRKILAAREASTNKLKQWRTVLPILQRCPSSAPADRVHSKEAVRSCGPVLTKPLSISATPKAFPPRQAQPHLRYYYRAIQSAKEYRKFVAARAPDAATRRSMKVHERSVARAASRRSLLLQAAADPSVYAVVDWDARCVALSGKFSSESALTSLSPWNLTVLPSQRPQHGTGEAHEASAGCAKARVTMHLEIVRRWAGLSAS